MNIKSELEILLNKVLRKISMFSYVINKTIHDYAYSLIFFLQ